MFCNEHNRSLHKPARRSLGNFFSVHREEVYRKTFLVSWPKPYEFLLASIGQLFVNICCEACGDKCSYRRSCGEYCYSPRFGMRTFTPRFRLGTKHSGKSPPTDHA